MSLFVHYRVPLVVEIEPASEEILSVHIVDESIDGPLAVTDDAGRSVRPNEKSTAIEIAQGQVWPGWMAGY